MARTVRIVNYAVNGGGVGHLVRLAAVSRWVRRYASHAGVRAEIYFLTSSEADGMLFAENFASFKLPSKTVVDDAGIDKIAYLALAKQWVWHSLGLLRPDLLVVDTFPRGSFGELLSALDLCRRRAFIYRPVKEDFAARADFQAMLPLYDAVLIPERREDVDPACVRVPDEARHRLSFTGPALSRERVELLPRAEARDRLGIEGDAIAVYVSAGGGGDPGAEAQLAAAIEALRGDPDLHLVVGAGPLYRGRVFHGSRISWLTGGGVSELMNGFDLAISAAGYNSFNELMHAGVPTLFLPQEKIADEQDKRARRAADAGAGELLERIDMAGLRAAVARWKDPAARAKASEAAKRVVPRNDSRALAAELLRLVLPPSEVDAAVAGVDDALLAASIELGTGTDHLFELGRVLTLRKGGNAPVGERAPSPGDVSARAVEVARAANGHGMSKAQTLKLAATVAGKVPHAGFEPRVAAVLSLIDAFAPYSDWAGADSLMKTFVAERDAPTADFAAAVADFLRSLGERRLDLYAGIAQLCAAQDGDGQTGNLELLRRATLRLDGTPA